MSSDQIHQRQAFVSRRGFLSGTAAVGLSILIQDTQPATLNDGTTTWALLSDTHISSDLGRTVRGANMAENLKTAVQQVLGSSPDRVLFNGDIAFKVGPPADYEAFLKIIAPLRQAKTPTHYTLGNHDNRENFTAAIDHRTQAPLKDKLVSAFVDSGVRWVFLDSLRRVGGYAGRLGIQQLEWLKQALDERAEIPTIVCLHHNPEKSLVGLQDAPHFLDLMTRRKQVEAVIFGHTHVYRLTNLDGLHLVNLPAVGYQFNPASPLGWVQARIQPGNLELVLRTLKEDQTTSQHTSVLEWRRDK